MEEYEDTSLEGFRKRRFERPSSQLYPPNRWEGSVTPEEICFVPVIYPFAVSETRIFCIQNRGLEKLRIEGITVVGPFEIEGVYPEVVHPEESFELGVAFLAQAYNYPPLADGGIYINMGGAAGERFIRLKASILEFPNNENVGVS